MASTKARSLVKGLIYEATAPLVLYAFTRELHIVFGYTAARIAMYFLYELLWKHVRWGKYPTDWKGYGWTRRDDDADT